MESSSSSPPQNAASLVTFLFSMYLILGSMGAAHKRRTAHRMRFVRRGAVDCLCISSTSPCLLLLLLLPSGCFIDDFEVTGTTAVFVILVGHSIKCNLISNQILALLVGQYTPCMTMARRLIEWTYARDRMKVEIEVAQILTCLENFSNEHDKNMEYKYGIILGGYDSKKKFQLYKIIVYRSDLSIEESEDLAYRSMFISSCNDKNTDGNVHFFEVTETNCGEIGTSESLPLYLRYYNVYDEKSILFSVYDDRGGPIAGDIFASYFCKTEGIKAAHCVDHRVANNNKRGFYFHRLIFISPVEAGLALSGLEDHSTGTRTEYDIVSKFPYFCSVLHNEVRLYVCKASEEVLNHIINNSTVKWDMK
ncbi:hypothetical protein OROGR_021272 [Orobanche gracilis]